MSKKRNKRNEDLPKYVTRTTSGYYLKPYYGRKDGQYVWGKSVWLGPPDLTRLALTRRANKQRKRLGCR